MPEILNQLQPQPRSKIPLRWLWGWIKGLLYRVLWKFQRLWGWPEVTAGARLSIQGRLRTRGPGKIILGNNVIIGDSTDLYTHSKNALIRIGHGTFLNGTRMSSQQEIQVGERCILADARIMDTDFHSLSRDRWQSSAKINISPVIIDENVWVAAGSAILRGTHIGRDSVIGFGSVVTGDIASGVIAAGNPARVISPLPDKST